MFLNILKKDLKRKKTMNVILLIFIIISTMFVASSVNNIMSVTKALDNFFEIADVPDYFLVLKGKDTVTTMGDTLKDVKGVEDYGCEEMIMADSSAFSFEGKGIDFKNTSIIMSFDSAQTKYFDMKNQEITKVEEGTVVLSGKTIANSDIEVGDMLTIKVGSKTLDVMVAQSCKDAVLGSDLMGMARFLLSEKDFQYLYSDNEEGVIYGSFWYLNTNDIDELTKVINNTDDVVFNGDKAMVKMAYALDMVIAGILLVISVCLIVVSFVVLKFTITFTLSEEFREIGVMKAIGLKNTRIRLLYLTKYLAMSVVGAFIGFFGSIPFGKMLLDNVSKSIVIKGENTILTNLICCIAVVAVILLFSFVCTSRVKKFTPIDAIRNGQTGERYTKKSFLRLRNSHGKPSFFMALNDILSAPKRYLSIIFTYTLCMIIVLVLVNSSNTLRSEKLIFTFGVHESDVYLGTENTEIMNAFTSGEREKFDGILNDIENQMAENDMPCEASIELYFKFNISHGDKNFKSMTLYGLNTTADMYFYHEGTAPQNKNEVAITPLTAEKLDAEIGDTIKIAHSGGEREYLVTAIYQSMNNLGEGVRLHQDAEVDFAQVGGCFAIQLDFTDNPDEKTVLKRIEKIKKIYDGDVMTGSEMVEMMTGVAGAIDAVKYLTLGLVIVIIALVTVLMERSFIAKEQGEIATLKAIGFNTPSIVKWHSLRFVIIGVVSSLVAILLSTPATNLAIDPVFKMMGAYFGVEYKIKPIEVFVIYPIILLVATIISSVLTSLYTKTIKPSQATTIE
ncbi:MAG: FtsX-like permease family protein [Oscillospiraceae bacterium]|nr:FtsX-like permease family protein [Oscillospiraceae bacterium]